MVERLEDIGAPLVADGQTTEAAEPGQGAFDDPSMAPQTLAALDAASGDAVADAALAQVTMAARHIIGFVSVELGGSPARPAAALVHRRHGIDQFVEEAAVVNICRGDPQGERDALGVGDNMTLGPGTAAIGRIGASLLAPLFAGTDALSTQARLQSIACAPPKRSSRTRCNRFHTPAACQSRSRRQHVIPDPHPISRGSISQGMPLLSTKTMPVSAARCGTSGLPPFGLGRSGGSNGSITLHRSSDTRGLAIPDKQPACTADPGFVRCSKLVDSLRKQLDAATRENASKKSQLEDTKRELQAARKPLIYPDRVPTWLILNFNSEGNPAEAQSVNVRWA
jgi:hypothetical protein